MGAPQTRRHPRAGGDPVLFSARERLAAFECMSAGGELREPINRGDVTWVPACAGMTNLARAAV